MLPRTRTESHALVVARRFGLAVFDGKLFAVGGFNRDPDGYLSSVETLSSAGGSWVAEANGLNADRYGCVGAPRARVLRDECIPLGDQRLVSGKTDWPRVILMIIASAVMNNNHASNDYQNGLVVWSSASSEQYCIID